MGITEKSMTAKWVYIVDKLNKMYELIKDGSFNNKEIESRLDKIIKLMDSFEWG